MVPRGWNLTSAGAKYNSQYHIHITKITFTLHRGWIHHMLLRFSFLCHPQANLSTANTTLQHLNAKRHHEMIWVTHGCESTATLTFPFTSSGHLNLNSFCLKLFIIGCYEHCSLRGRRFSVWPEKNHSMDSLQRLEWLKQASWVLRL